jgi:hypothetical protein
VFLIGGPLDGLNNPIVLRLRYRTDVVVGSIKTSTRIQTCRLNRLSDPTSGKASEFNGTFAKVLIVAVYLQDDFLIESYCVKFGRAVATR